MLRDFVFALDTGREPLMTLDRAQLDLEMIENACWEPSLTHTRARTA